MKKYIVFMIVFILACAFLTGCGSFKKEKKLNDLKKIKERGYLLVGVKGDSAPFGYYKNGILTGIDIEIAKEISKNIFKDSDYDKVRFVIVNAQNRINKLNSSEVDMLIATMSVNEKRKLVVDFSTPYFVANQKIMVRPGSKITNLNYFNTKGRLAVILGTTGEKISHLVAPNANVIGARSYLQAIKYLSTYQVDAILGDDCILKGLNDGQFKIVNRTYSKENYAVAVRKSQDSKELLNVVNATITELMDKKKINIIKSHYKI